MEIPTPSAASKDGAPIARSIAPVPSWQGSLHVPCKRDRQALLNLIKRTRSLCLSREPRIVMVAVDDDVRRATEPSCIRQVQPVVHIEANIGDHKVEELAAESCSGDLEPAVTLDTCQF